jgi:lipoate-protein ligase A
VIAAEALREGLARVELIDPRDPVTAIWWRVAADAVVLGRGSRVSADDAACRAAGVAVVRRGSGGGPVLWGPDLLALDVLVPAGHPLHTADVAASYRWLGEAFAAALGELGVPATAVPPDTARRLNDRAAAERACFAGCSPWEVLAGERKGVGLSQVRRRSGALLQAGILLRHRPDRLPRLLALDPVARAATVASLAARAIALDTLTGTTTAEVIATVEGALADAAPDLRVERH